MKLIPFGKYKDQPIEILINDPEYRNWLLAQSWFAQKFPDLKLIIINNFKETNETPEHNKLQGDFLDDKFCIAFLKNISPTLFENPARIPDRNWSFKFGEKITSLRISTRSFENAGIDVLLSFKIVFDQTMDLFEDGMFNYLGSDEYETKPIRIEIKPTVSDDYPAVLRQMKASGANILYLVEYTGIGITEEMFVKYFANERIKVVFEENLKVQK
ncbi:hypothetical protein [Nonlabens spongiae]|nr:hypothetical protein [Nonlabens spongiae]